jgi:Zn ribbon nucleic-acid-binding protein
MSEELLPCPTCKTADYLGVYKYENGWLHIECDKCFYMGEGFGNKKQAIKAWNTRFKEEKE